jgi:hypothetical protein
MGTIRFNKLILTFLITIIPIAVYADSKYKILSKGETWKYLIVADNLLLKKDTLEYKKDNWLGQFENIDVAGYKEARLFVEVAEDDVYDKGEITDKSIIRISCFHNTNHDSSLYFQHEMHQEVTKMIGGWIKIPVIGPDLRIIVFGDYVPLKNLRLRITLYCLK